MFLQSIRLCRGYFESSSQYKYINLTKSHNSYNIIVNVLLLASIRLIYGFYFRYGPSGPPKPISCDHGKKPGAYRCKEITLSDQTKFHGKFYINSGKISELKTKQDWFILKYTDCNVPKQSRPTDNSRGKKLMTVKYFIYKHSTKERVPVCQKAFIDTIRISQSRVRGVVHRFFISGSMPKENRGGDRKTNLFHPKKTSVLQFIKKFKAVETHYCRSKTSTRVYLDSVLNIKRIWKMYNNELTDDDLKVKESYFRYVFRHNFNIGFGKPSTDECSTCISLRERIKHSTDPASKQTFMTELRVHKLKAKAFYKFLQESREDLLTISFDCQKNQVLPRVQDQSAYYSRQIYKYNLAIVVGHSKIKMTKDNVYMYHWEENQYNKTPNEIISALYNCLCKLDIPDNVKVIRLASDGCGGQNKNYFMIGMLGKWLLDNSPKNIKHIEYFFPMVGHSFLPSDRVFGMIEREIKKCNTIISPDEYTDIFSRFGTVVPLAGNNFGWKEAVSKVLRPPAQWHFKFNQTKRFYLKRSQKGHDVKIKGEQHYRSDYGKYQRICKPGLKYKDMNVPNQIPPGVPINKLKLKDVTKLLAKHFGDDWRSLDLLSYYKDVEIKNNDTAVNDEAIPLDIIPLCDNIVEETVLVV